MSGLAGIVCSRGCSEEGHTRLLEKMCEAQAHRGPDDRRVVSLERVALAATHLRMIDLSAAVSQPMQDEDGSVWIVFDGALYNYRELRDELAERGHRFRTESDTEVVLHAYREWGEACLDHFIGIFAFAIHERRKGTTTLVRDHFGVKPLYYAIRDQHLFFASEIKALIAVDSPQRLNERALVEWSLYRHVMPPETLFEGIASLPPGQLMEIPRDQLAADRRCYYDPSDHVDSQLYSDYAKKSPSDMVSEVDSSIQASVSETLVGEVPIGVMLSGGVDSSLITAIAARQREISAFHLSIPDDPRLDERRVAERVARDLAVPLECYSMESSVFRRELARVTYLNEIPLWNMQCVSFHLLARRAREHGVKVLLTGDSIGHMFGMYAGRMQAERWLMPAQSVVSRLPRGISRALEKAVYRSKGLPVTSPGFVDELPSAVHFIDGYTRLGRRRRYEQVYSFVDDPVSRAILATKMADLTEWLPRFFHRGDRLAMAVSAEYRNPFQDVRSVHTSINLPLSFALREGTVKWTLKEVATRYLPRSVVFRKKVAWDLPVEKYLEPLARPEVFRDGFCSAYFGIHENGLEQLLANWRSDLPSFFNLLQIEVWGRLFFLGESVEQVTARVLGDGE
jgi:asparagine synthase (glutamine-hydrolysing)